jgi:hypothetical protein
VAGYNGDGRYGGARGDHLTTIDSVRGFHRPPIVSPRPRSDHGRRSGRFISRLFQVTYIKWCGGEWPNASFRPQENCKPSSNPSARGFAQGRVRSGEGDKEEMVPAPVPETRG